MLKHSRNRSLETFNFPASPQTSPEPPAMHQITKALALRPHWDALLP